MWVQLYRPNDRHAAEWRICIQEAPDKKWYVHYNNVVRGEISADSFREMMNCILSGWIVKADVEFETIVKVNRWMKYAKTT